MRVGTNPLNRKATLPPYKRHRIIVPIYIAAEGDYFQECLQTLSLCLRSLMATVDTEHVSITVINNDSVPAVDEILRPYVESRQIDRYIRHQVNRGKPDPVAGEILAAYETFVTVADCDVLFYPNWMFEIEKVFNSTRGVGAVSPFPAPTLHSYENSTTWISALLPLPGMKPGKFVSDEALDKFAHSVGKGQDFFAPSVRKTQFRFRKEGPYLIGAGHFVVTMRRAAFSGMRYQPKLTGASGGERDIDAQVDAAGYMRLSTPEFLVYHLGNRMEDWMEAATVAVEATPAQKLHSDAEFALGLASGRRLSGRLPRWARHVLFAPARMFVSGVLKRRSRD